MTIKMFYHLSCPIYYPLGTFGYWALETRLVEVNNWIFTLYHFNFYLYLNRCVANGQYTARWFLKLRNRKWIFDPYAKFLTFINEKPVKIMEYLTLGMNSVIHKNLLHPKVSSSLVAYTSIILIAYCKKKKSENENKVNH